MERQRFWSLVPNIGAMEGSPNFFVVVVAAVVVLAVVAAVLEEVSVALLVPWSEDAADNVASDHDGRGVG